MSPIVRYCKDKDKEEDEEEDEDEEEEEDEDKDEDEDKGAHLTHLLGPILGLLMVFHAILRQILNYCFCAISLCEFFLSFFVFFPSMPTDEPTGSSCKANLEALTMTLQ